MSLLELYTLAEDSRGNVKRLLKAPEWAALEAHNTSNKYSYALMNAFLATMVENPNMRLDRATDYWKELIDNRFEGRESAAEEHFYDVWNVFMARAGDHLVRAMEQDPSIEGKMKTNGLKASDVEKALDKSSKSDPKELLARAQSVGIVFPNGWFWAPLKPGECWEEGNLMGHCGTDERGTMWTLRDPQNKPHVTLTMDDKEASDRPGVHQIKGKENKPPHVRYWPHLIKFFAKFKPLLLDPELGRRAPELFRKLEAAATAGEAQQTESKKRKKRKGRVSRLGWAFALGDRDDDPPTDDAGDGGDVGGDGGGGGMGESAGALVRVFRGIKGMSPKLLARMIGRVPTGAGSVDVSVRVPASNNGYWTARPEIATIYAGTENVSGKGSSGFDVMLRGEYSGVPIGAAKVFKPKSGTIKIDRVAFVPARGEYEASKSFFFSVMGEGPIEDSGFSARFIEKTQDGDRVVEIKLIGPRGNEIGWVKAVEDDRLGVFMVKSSEIMNPALRGKGIGAQLYVALNDYVKRKYRMPLASDIFRSDDAERLWQSLQRKGAATSGHEYPFARPKRGEDLDFYKMEAPGSFGAPMQSDAELDGTNARSPWDDLDERAMESMGMSVEVEEEGGDLVAFLLDRGRHMVGRMTLAPEPQNGLARILDVQIDREHRGKGVGTDMYRWVDGWLQKNKGWRLASDTTRLPPAERVWQKLASLGLAKKMDHPAFPTSGFYQFK